MVISKIGLDVSTEIASFRVRINAIGSVVRTKGFMSPSASLI